MTAIFTNESFKELSKHYSAQYIENTQSTIQSNNGIHLFNQYLLLIYDYMMKFAVSCGSICVGVLCTSPVPTHDMVHFTLMELIHLIPRFNICKNAIIIRSPISVTVKYSCWCLPSIQQINIAVNSKIKSSPPHGKRCSFWRRCSNKTRS